MGGGYIKGPTSVAGHGPQQDGAFLPDTHNRPGIGRYCGLGDGAAVPDTDCHDRAVVIVPKLDEAVATAADKHLAVCGYAERIHVCAGAAVHDSDGAAVERVPVGHLAICSRRQNLALVGGVQCGLEESRSKERVVAQVFLQIPHNAAAIAAGRDALGVI